MTLTEPLPVAAPDAGVIEDARERQRLHRWMAAAAAAAAAAAIAVVLVLVLGGGGTSNANGGLLTPGAPLKLTFRHGLAYENGQPIAVGVTPDFGAGTVGLDVTAGGSGVSGGNYPTPSQPVFGPDAEGFSVGDGRAGPDGEIDITLVGSTVASMRVKGLGTFKPVSVLGLLPGEKAFVFYRPPGALGTVLGPGINPNVLQSSEKAKHEPAITETLYDAAGKPIPITVTPSFHLPSSYWQTPATPAATGRCALHSTLTGVATQWGEVATAIAPDHAVSGPAFLSCLHTWYRWHGTGFEVGVLLNAESPGSPPAPLWNATPLASHPGLFQIKPVQVRIQTQLNRFNQLSLAALTRRIGRAAAERQIANQDRIIRQHERTHPWRVLAPAAVARRVGPAWLVVRYGNSLAQRIQFLNGLHTIRLDLNPTS